MLSEIRCRCEVIKNFAPSWFAAVMGTGILAISSSMYSDYIPWLDTLAVWLFYFNIFLFSIFLVPWVLRWIMYRENALADLRHPILSNFYPTLTVGMMVLSSDFLILDGNMLAAEVLWALGAAGTVFFSFLTPYLVFKGDHVTLDHINPAWFIPPVGLIVIPIAGSVIAASKTGTLREIILLIDIFGWGAGFFLYISLLAVCMYRFILHHPLPNVLAPTIWINLGPIGAGTLALINIVKYSGLVTIGEPFMVMALLLWSFGLWWFCMAVLMTLHYIRRLKLPYALSWWAFIFPFGAYVAATYAMSNIFNIRLMGWLGLGLYLMLAVMWAVTLVNTAKHAYRGSVFRGG